MIIRTDPMIHEGPEAHAARGHSFWDRYLSVALHTQVPVQVTIQPKGHKEKTATTDGLLY